MKTGDHFDDETVSTLESNSFGESRRGFLQGIASAAIVGIHVGSSTALSAQDKSANQARDYFQKAQPIWPAGREGEKNLLVGFATVIPYEAGDVVMRIAASTLYRVYVNGRFCAFGPARGPHGYFRIDHLDPTSLFTAGQNRIVIEVAGANINSYWTLNQKAFLQAEIQNETVTIAATGSTQFECVILTQRLQKVQRYSFQRTFSEAYRLDAENARWREGLWHGLRRENCHILAQSRLLDRRALYPLYEKRQPMTHAATGAMNLASTSTQVVRPRFITDIGSKLLGYREAEFEVAPYLELQHYKNTVSTPTADVYDPREWASLRDGQFHLYDFGGDLTGFIGVSVKVMRRTKLYITFDETLVDGDVDFTRLTCANVIYYELAPGAYELETFEPYTMRFVKFIALVGDCTIRSVFLRTFETSDGQEARFSSSDNGLNQIFEAARRTYRQNAVDLFTDCPSRERAGWLCDSYFTARAAQSLTGNSRVETAFLENYVLPESFEFLPKGMLPMCYPADHYDGQYIVNWPMWLVLQLEEYLKRTNDRTMVDRFLPKVDEFLHYLEQHANGDGLLENLESYLFVEWSDANLYLKGVNYPTNMLYAAMLACVSRLYGREDCMKRAEDIRQKIRAQSYDGEFFVDNAVRIDGMLTRTGNRSEACQYYAFYFGAASFDTYPKLWSTLQKEFGSMCDARKVYPNVAPSNALMGNVLRLELLSRTGAVAQLLKEAKEQLLYMADQTGTLWEHTSPRASLDHAFASHIAHVLHRDALGLRKIDSQEKRVELHFAESGLAWCEGHVPTAEGAIGLRWRRNGTTIEYHCELPAGYRLQVSAGSELVVRPMVNHSPASHE